MAAGTTKLSWRLQEFEAHSRTVSCSCLGKNSGRLLATGGDDCRVNIWAISKTNCVMSLTGHKNPVECVQFSVSEEQVAAGSQSGSIRVWDLEAAKILRTLIGHKAGVTGLGFHPFGNFLASSSVDTSIKLWDVRRKGYVFRYKGHTEAVRSLAFSPDGKWLASASDDGTVKLWDLFQGKTITQFESHSGAVGVVQFHPNEYLLASGSADRSRTVLLSVARPETSRSRTGSVHVREVQTGRAELFGPMMISRMNIAALTSDANLAPGAPVSRSHDRPPHPETPQQQQGNKYRSSISNLITDE